MRVSPPPITQLPVGERQPLLDDLNYLNTAEIKAFCRRQGIPYAITVETSSGDRHAGEDDRKGIMLRRVRHFLQTGEVLPATRFRASVVSSRPLSTMLTPDDRLHYGQYDKKNSAMLAVLGGLTAGRFRNGAVARILAREFWSRGTAPTFREFASAWLQAIETHARPNPEWAFLSDLADRRAGASWKVKRAQIARRVMPVLRRISAAPPTTRFGQRPDRDI